MNIKKVIIFFITILTILGSIILNFKEFINDYWPVNIKNVIVTAAYIVTWIIVLSISIICKYSRIVKVYSIFWLITLIHAMLIIISKATGANVGWAILSAILFLCPWYGLTFYIKESISIGIVIAICSLSILVINCFFISANKPNINQSK